jgi:DUF1980 C-terminal domain
MGSHHEHHHVDDTYFLDQICMVALSGGFGVICLSLYFIQKSMLNLLLGQQFHAFVLGSGIALVVVAVIRAAMLWSMAGGKALNDVHDHADDHETHEHSHSHEDCDHDHGDCGHEHSPSHDHAHSHSHAESHHDHEHSHAEVAQSRAFGHTPIPAPAHGHSHSHDDHDHGWAPWRYVVLLVPIILFLLGLPNKGPSVDVNKIAIFDASRDAHEEAIFFVTLAALSGDGYAPLGAMAARAADSVAQDLQAVDVKLLEGIAEKKTDRDFWKGKAIRVRGQFVPQTDRVFSLVRFRIQCCAGDAIQVSIPVVAKENVNNVKAPAWVEVDGRIDFREDARGVHKTVVIVSKHDHVRECNPDLNPYLQ